MLLINLPLTSPPAVHCLRGSAYLSNTVGHGYRTLSNDLLCRHRANCVSLCASASCHSDSTPFHALNISLLQRLPYRLPLPSSTKSGTLGGYFDSGNWLFVDDHYSSHLSADSAAIYAMAFSPFFCVSKRLPRFHCYVRAYESTISREAPNGHTRGRSCIRVASST